MKITSIQIPEEVLERINDLVRMGIYSNRSEFIRAAILNQLREDMLYMQDRNRTSMQTMDLMQS